tara:strand:+ start:2177 stop:2410 length:234 start_codon:yes stop_codon:yes gene_type:complete
VSSDSKADKRDNKVDAKVTKTSAKADLIDAKARKAMAVAQKRKWLVILIGIGIAAFYALKSGAGSGLINIIKSKLGM